MHAGLVGISANEIKESYSDLERVMIEAIEKERRVEIRPPADG
jgi:hypothetical protein